ncbi:Hsp33 family molecular chaperone HslO, partial [Salmonella sp. s59944]|uniref:Hsp33 family molecular chaperone HslO n=1 Tax=Salmonella sp. s59944 TaxID=3159720 RepID=UPI00397F73E3
LMPGDLLYLLYHVDGVRLFRPRTVRHQSRCSRRKVVATLKAFPKAEIMSMADQGRIDVRCEFCNVEYAFNATDLDRLFGQ